MEVKYWYTTLLVQANAQCSLQDNYTLLHGSEIWTDHVGKCPCLEKYTPQHEEDIFVIRQLHSMFDNYTVLILPIHAI